jgi:DUF1680 family protein
MLTVVSTTNPSRRDVLRTTALVAAASTLPVQLVSAAAKTTVPSSDANAPAAREKLHAFRHADVSLTAGPLKRQFDGAVQFWSSMDEDRPLKVYRQRAGLAAPGSDMGGWYDVGGFAPGHCLGQWMSALARFSAATGDASIKAKLQRLIDGFAATLDSRPSFYEGARFPAYTYDKHVLGLVEAHDLAGIPNALQVLARATAAALPNLPEKALTREEMRARPHKDISYTWDESYTLPENLFYAHEVTGDAQYLQLARRFLHDEPYFKPLADGKNVLPGLHAYSHVNALSSAARAYLVLGDAMHLRTIQNAWDMLEQTQQYASGGWGPDEAFVEPGKGLLGESLAKTHKHFETPCGSYASFKLARYLLRITADPRYGDGLERVLYNGILGARAPQPDGATFYYSDYHAEAHKTYHPDKWPCCAGTYPQAIADYLINTYFHDGDAIYVNLYTPSRVRWNAPGGRVVLEQSTDYPESGDVRIRVKSDQPREFAINLRVPRWAGDDMRIALSGQLLDVATKPGTFATVRRTWRDGDFLELKLPLPYRTEPIDPQHPDLLALLRGPLLLVATGDRPATLPGEGKPAGEGWVPFYRVAEQRYTTYTSRGNG